MIHKVCFTPHLSALETKLWWSAPSQTKFCDHLSARFQKSRLLNSLLLYIENHTKSTWSWPRGRCIAIGLRNWFRGLVARVGHFHDAHTSLTIVAIYKNLSRNFVWLEIKRKENPEKISKQFGSSRQENIYSVAYRQNQSNRTGSLIHSIRKSRYCDHKPVNYLWLAGVLVLNLINAHNRRLPDQIKFASRDIALKDFEYYISIYSTDNTCNLTLCAAS